MRARCSLLLYSGVATILLCCSLASAASLKERHNQTDSVSSPQAGGEVRTAPSAVDPLTVPAAPGLTFQLDGDSWACFQDPLSEKLYFHNHDKEVTQWSDPRVAARQRAKKALTPRDKRMRLSIAIIPLAVFLIAMSARIIYLQKYYPDLLWPTKERKARKKYRNKEKMPRQRFKVSQDGKGGRSANS